MTDPTTQAQALRTMGLDLGDRYTHFCIIDAAGSVVEQDRLPTGRGAFEATVARRERMRIVLEAGTHSAWVSRLLSQAGHEVIVGNPRRTRAIYDSDSKNDKLDAETLARLGRADAKLLHPIQHRGEQAQVDLARIRARDALVRSRTLMANHVRGAVKACGGKIPPCSPETLPKMLRHVPEELRPALSPLFNSIGRLNAEIARYDRAIERLSRKDYPETQRLRAIHGVGPLTSLAFVLTIDDVKRFRHSRDVGAYLGLRPRQDQSGDLRKQLGITKSGDCYMRRLLVSAAHYMLGPFGRDCDLRRWGLQLASRGAKNGKKRAVVAVARKLAVLMHRLLVTDRPYDPMRHAERKPRGTTAAMPA